MKATAIIKKLKKQIEQKGYVENLGQKELDKYKNYVFSKYSYSDAAKLYADLNNEIERL